MIAIVLIPFLFHSIAIDLQKKRVETENIASKPSVSLINKLTMRITSTAFSAS